MIMNPSDDMDRIAMRLAQIACTASVIRRVADFDADIADAIAGLEPQLHDLSGQIDAINTAFQFVPKPAPARAVPL